MKSGKTISADSDGDDQVQGATSGLGGDDKSRRAFGQSCFNAVMATQSQGNLKAYNALTASAPNFDDDDEESDSRATNSKDKGGKNKLRQSFASNVVDLGGDSV